MSNNVTPEPAKGCLVPILMVLGVLGVVAPVVWVANRSPEPPAPTSKSEDPVERLTRQLRPATMDWARIEAAETLGHMGPQASAAVPQLIQLLWDEEPKVRKAATAALDRIDKDWPKRDEAIAAVPRLIQLLGNKDKEIRMTAETLDRIDKDWPKREEASAAVPRLIALLWDKDETVRKAAAGALDRIDKDWPKRDEARAVVLQLIKLLSNKDTAAEVRKAATETLDRIDKDWPKRDDAKRVVADLLDLLGEPVSDHEEVTRTLDRIDGHWRESEKAKTVVLKLIKQGYRTDRGWSVSTLDSVDKNWRESPEAKKAVSELIDELTAKAKESGYVSPLEGSLLGSAVEKAAIRALIEKLDTRSRKEFETTVAVLDGLHKDWPQYKEAKAVATKLTARLTTWNPTPWEVTIPPILPETLDRMHPTWAQSDNAGKAAPVLVTLTTSSSAHAARCFHVASTGGSG